MTDLSKISTALPITNYFKKLTLARMTFVYQTLLALIPVLLLLGYIYHKGNAKNIPTKQLMWAFWTSFLFPIGYFTDLLDNTGIYVDNYQTVSEKLWKMFITGACAEEMLKFIILCLILKVFHFDGRYRIVIVSAFIGLGFACSENLLYIYTNDNWLFLSIIRAVISVPDHFSYAIAMGSLYFYAQHNGKTRRILYVLALVIPICLHWLGNAIVMIPELDIWDIILGPVCSITLFVCANRLIKKVREDQGYESVGVE